MYPICPCCAHWQAAAAAAAAAHQAPPCLQLSFQPAADWPIAARPPLACPQIRSMIKRQQQGKYVAKVTARQERKLHVAANPLPIDPLADVFK